MLSWKIGWFSLRRSAEMRSTSICTALERNERQTWIFRHFQLVLHMYLYKKYVFVDWLVRVMFAKCRCQRFLIIVFVAWWWWWRRARGPDLGAESVAAAATAFARRRPESNAARAFPRQTVAEQASVQWRIRIVDGWNNQKPTDTAVICELRIKSYKILFAAEQ